MRMLKIPASAGVLSVFAIPAMTAIGQPPAAHANPMLDRNCRINIGTPQNPKWVYDNTCKERLL